MIKKNICLILALCFAVFCCSFTAEAQLSDDKYSFEIEINGDVIAFPLSFEEFTSLGWEYAEDDADEPLDSHYYEVAKRFNLNELECYASLINLSVNALPRKECLVAGFSVDSYQMESAPGTILKIPGGFEFGAATMQEVTAAYGSPTDTYEGDLYTKISYELDYDRGISLYFDAQTEALNDIEIENFVEPEGFEAGEVSDEVPAIVQSYTAPAELSDDLSDFVIDYAGALYSLPAPVSEFIANGWEIIQDDTDTPIEGRGYGWVTLTYDNQKLRTIAENYSENATGIENCFITSVKADPYDARVEMTAAMGITLGMAEGELMALIEASGLEYETEEGSSYNYYRIFAGQGVLDCYEIYADSQDGLVYSIEVENAPAYEDFAAA